MATRSDELQECRAPIGGVDGCRLAADPAPGEQGWEWRCNADGARLREVADAYRALGFEVRIEPLDLRGLGEDCAGCREALARSSAVFVRPASQPR